MNQYRMTQLRIQPYHLSGEIENERGLIARLRRRIDLAVGPLLRLRAAQMHEQEAGNERRLAVLSAEREDRAPRCVRVVVDRADEIRLPRQKLHAPADAGAFRHKAVRLDPIAN